MTLSEDQRKDVMINGILNELAVADKGIRINTALDSYNERIYKMARAKQRAFSQDGIEDDGPIWDSECEEYRRREKQHERIQNAYRNAVTRLERNADMVFKRGDNFDPKLGSFSPGDVTYGAISHYSNDSSVSNVLNNPTSSVDERSRVVGETLISLLSSGDPQKEGFAAGIFYRIYGGGDFIGQGDPMEVLE